MDRYIKWIHISDWHVESRIDSHAKCVFEALVRDIESACTRADHLLGRSEPFKPDFIFHTGDLAFSGSAKEYELAGQYIKRVLKASGDLTLDQFFLVPGNHDVYDPYAVPAELLSVIDTETAYNEATADWLENRANSAKLLSRFRNYQVYFHNQLAVDRRMTNKRPWFADYVPNRTGVTVGVIGLCSALISRKDDEAKRRKMFLSRYQIDAALTKLTSKHNSPTGGPDVTIALLHHPLTSLNDFDRARCDSFLRGKVDFVLHGHLHEPRSIGSYTPDGVLQEMGAGASYENWRSHDSKGMNVPYSYQLVEVNVNTGMAMVYFRKWASGSEEFIPYNEVYKGANKTGSCEFRWRQEERTERPRPVSSPLLLTLAGKPIAESGMEAKSIFGGYVDRESHREMASKIEFELWKGALDNKYLYWHVSSRKLYHALVNENSYSIARESLNVSKEVFPSLASELLTKWDSGPFTLVSLGVGTGEKETLLAGTLLQLKNSARISLVFLDINYQMLQWAMNRLAQNNQLNPTTRTYFIHGDFDRLAILSTLLPAVEGPMIFMVLGGVFGNQKEDDFLELLKGIQRPNSYLLFGVQTVDAVSNDPREELAGYRTEANKRFVELPLVHFDAKYGRLSEGKREIRVELSSEVPIVPNAETISTVAQSPKFDRVRLAYSRRYKLADLKQFLSSNKMEIIWESDAGAPRYWKGLVSIPTMVG